MPLGISLSTSPAVGLDLNSLYNTAPTVQGKAMQSMDGRSAVLVLAKLRDSQGLTKPGILVQLLDSSGGRLLDQSLSDARGSVLLRFPQGTSTDSAPATGVLHVIGLDSSNSPGTKMADPAVVVPQGAQHVLMDVALNKLPDNVQGNGDDPLQRLPTDFTPALYDDLVRMYGSADDPLLGGRSGSNRFASRRAPSIRNISIARLEDRSSNTQTDPSQPLRRYLVTLRQEWIFLGYSLGELNGLSSLPPGQVVNQTVNTLTSDVQQLRSEAEQAVQQAQQSVLNSVSQAMNAAQSMGQSFQSDAFASTDTHLDSQTNTWAAGGGGGFSLGFISFGGGGGGGGVSTSANLRNQAKALLSQNFNLAAMQSSVLQANSSTRAAQTAVNSAVRQASDQVKQLQTSALNTLQQVSPLLSRVTNLLNWTIYENYAIRSEVADVVEVVGVSPQSSTSGDAFSAADIVEYEPYFSPFLLNQRLRGNFDVLRQMVEAAQQASAPIVAVSFAVNYSAPNNGADLSLSIKDQSVPIRLYPGGSRATAYLQLDSALVRDSSGQLPGQLSLELTARNDFPWWWFVEANNTNEPDFTIQVNSIEITFQTAGGSTLYHTENLGQSLVVNKAGRHCGPVSVNLTAPVPPTVADGNPLYAHIKRNQRYYLGLLLEAAIENPSLRQDAPQLAAVDPNVWRLPLLGLEADKLLVLRNVQSNDTFGQSLLNEPGAATFVQRATPGAYSEALQGILQLDDLVGKIPKDLQRSPYIVPPGYQILDLNAPPAKSGTGNGVAGLPTVVGNGASPAITG